ncbi:hypothetical protein P4H70_23080 [Paenibacillus ehimensis]|uniref:hypothetical protein n=1 Tax=Paenibacillus ehimensis TaxID=79264 RepID=UPI002DB95D2B|nr:hypothetical protein [Paenibacillus ehimensis]MEC0211829.1 hypothetical protein [Paenibacillus ehimensis]
MPYETIVSRINPSFYITVRRDWGQDNVLRYEDFNRLETNTKVLRDMFIFIQYNIPEQTYVTNRTMPYIDFLSSINRIEQNIEAIRATSFTPPGYPGTKTWVVGMGFEYNDMNRLEEDIYLLFTTAEKIYDSIVYCGTINCGYARGTLPLV